MFRNIFGMLAALIVSTSVTPAAADVPLNQRIANAQAKISELDSLAAPGEALRETKSKAEGQQLAQHWHNHRWGDWNNWNNWGNHHHHHHHR